MVQMVRQRVYQIAAGYEDCNETDYLRINPALRLPLGKDRQQGPEFLTTPGGGMSISPPLSPWRIITGRCWP